MRAPAFETTEASAIDPIKIGEAGHRVAAPVPALEPLSPALLSGVLRVVEQAIVELCGLGVYLVYVHPGPASSQSQYIAAVCVGLILSGVIADRLGAYSAEHLVVERMRIGGAILAWVLAFGAVLAIAFAFKISTVYSRVWAVGWLGVSAWAIAVCRIVAGVWIRSAARSGRFSRRAVIVGAGRQGHALAAHMLAESDPRVRVVGFVDDRKTRVAREYRGWTSLARPTI